MKKIHSIYYVAELNLPSKSAYSIHVMKMCEAFSSLGYKTNLFVINHKDNKEKIHLFVRKMSSINGRTLPFTYCGEMNYKSINGNAPINVDFELIEPLNEKLKQEFLRL